MAQVASGEIRSLSVVAIDSTSDEHHFLTLVRFETDKRLPWLAQVDEYSGLDGPAARPDDQLAYWLATPGQQAQFEAFLAPPFSATPLAQYCALHTHLADRGLAAWLGALAETADALVKGILPASHLHRAGFTLPAGYFQFAGVRPWLCRHPAPMAATCGLFEAGQGLALRLSRPATLAWPLLPAQAPYLFCVGAGSPAELAQQLQELTQRVHPTTDLGWLAASLAQQPAGPYRAALVAGTADELTERLTKLVRSVQQSPRSPGRSRQPVYWNATGLPPGKVAALFPGQGAQHPQLLRQLCMRFPQLRAWFNQLEAAVVQATGILPSLSLYPPTAGATAEQQAALLANLYSQEGGNPSVVVAGIALHALLQSFGCRFDALVGHSSGEISALIAGGSLRFDTEAELFTRLGSITQQGAAGSSRGEIPTGRFFSVTTTEAGLLEQLLEELTGMVFLAMDNCPQQRVLFTRDEHADHVRQRLSERGVLAIELPFDRAYHTPLFEVEIPSIQQVYSQLDVGPPHTPVFSCIELAYFPPEPAAIREWATRNWTHCVRFRQACQHLHEQGVRLFLELGPGNTLSGFVNNTLNVSSHKALPVDQDGGDSYLLLLQALGQLFVEGHALNLSPLFPAGAPSPALPGAAPLAPAGAAPIKMELPATAALAVAAPATPKAPSLPGATPAVPATTIPAAPPVAPATNQVASGRAASLGLAHFQLMQEFLAMEARLAATALAHTRRQAAGGPPAPAQPAPPIDLSARLAQLPLVDWAEWHSPHRLSCGHQLRHEYDTFLLHHTLGRYALADHAAGGPLPVMPLAMTIELLAEAASLLFPADYVVRGLAEVRALQWITVDGDSLALRLDVQLTTHGPWAGSAFVQVFSEAEPESPAASAFVQLAPDYHAAPPARPFAGPRPGQLRWEAESFFDQCLFHGSAFACIEELTGLADDGLEVQLTIPPHDELFAGPPPPLKTPAQLLDVPGHAAAYWLVEHGDRCFGIFPLLIERLEFFAPPPPAFTKLTGRGHLDKSGTLLRSQFEIAGLDGAVYGRLAGCLFAYYRFGLAFLRSHYWTGPHSYYSQEVPVQSDRLLACEAHSLPDELLRQGGGLWLKSLLHMFCTRSERAVWASLPAGGRRREQWLLGRIAAKEAVRRWAMRLHSLPLLPPDIEIGYDAHGKPVVSCERLLAFGPVPDISISHSGRRAVAAAAQPGYAVGIDLEETADVPGRNQALEIAFADDELAAVRRYDGLTLLELTSAKEAAAKLVGLGLLGRMRQWRVTGRTSLGVHMQVAAATVEVHLTTRADAVLCYCTLPQAEAAQARTTIRQREQTFLPA